MISFKIVGRFLYWDIFRLNKIRDLGIQGFKYSGSSDQRLKLKRCIPKMGPVRGLGAELIKFGA